MTYEAYTHECIHQAQALNATCEKEFHISLWPRWDYDLDAGTLTFSEGGAPKVQATVLAAGTTSPVTKTWLWGWANDSLPSLVTAGLTPVRHFGEIQHWPALTDSISVADEFTGWAMASITATLLRAKGIYSCPDEDGCLYLIYTGLRLIGNDEIVETVACDEHGSGFSTYVCGHLASETATTWVSAEPDESNRWPDAWCESCNQTFEQDGEWNDSNQHILQGELLCHRCYEKARTAASKREVV